MCEELSDTTPMYGTLVSHVVILTVFSIAVLYCIGGHEVCADRPIGSEVRHVENWVKHTVPMTFT